MNLEEHKYQIIKWYQENARELPWRESKNPYKIWLSEIILQQTQVKQGLPYFLKFVKLFPTVTDLANADEETVLKAWQGLGYYSRARNLHFAAKYISNELKGIFPNNYKDLLKLKGVGDYTASAIASIAFNEAVPAIDGNVNRFISRLFDIKLPVDSKEGQNEIRFFLKDLLDYDAPGDFNQALMELGALVCRPLNPNCKECPVQEKCLAYANKTIQNRPIKKAKVVVKKVFIDYIFFKYQDFIILEKRSDKGIWKNMYEFPQATFDKKPKDDAHLEKLRLKYSNSNETITYIKSIKHKLTHRDLHIRFFSCELKEKPHQNLFSSEDLESKAMPKPIFEFLKDKI